MRTQASSKSVTHSARRSLRWAFAIIVVICGVLYLRFASAFPPHLRRFSGVGGEPGAEPDATTLISTLVVIYTFFAAAYGTLAPSLIGKEGRTFWRAWALIYISLALILDLGRVWNSIGDLYATTMRHLPAAKVYDAAEEFTRYLVVNAIVLLFALAVTFLPAERLRTIWSGLTGKPERPPSGKRRRRLQPQRTSPGSGRVRRQRLGIRRRSASSYYLSAR